MDVSESRRGLLKVGAVADATSAVAVTDLARPRPSAAAQTPKRGGVFRFAGFDPPNLDPQQSVHWWTVFYQPTKSPTTGPRVRGRREHGSIVGRT
jgi:hypothetical protein